MKTSVDTFSTESKTSPAAAQALETLRDFLKRFDSGSLFKVARPGFYRELRIDIPAALSTLLVWNRPFLQSAMGIHWPYSAFYQRVDTFEALALNHPDTFVRRQATLFLASLPFPRQWQWLLHCERQPMPDPEIKTLLQAEKREIHAKLIKKAQKQFKLRHFCQILKKPDMPGEKGVLRIFSLPYLLINPHLLKALSRFYVLYVEPPMGVVYRHAWWRYFTNLDDPCLFGVGSGEDRLFLDRQPGILTTTLAHGDFLDSTVDVNAAPQKARYDIAFNATFDDMPRKRHALMLKLLQDPLLRSKSALFLGRGEPGNIEAFTRLVANHDLSGRVTVRSNLRRSEIPFQLAQCRVGIHLSLYENACRGIYEFFRSNLPCVISSSMGGINRQIFNAQTGMAVPDSQLPETIAGVLHRSGEFSPRAWFLHHSGSHNNTLKLNETLKQIFKQQGYRWQADIVPLTSSGASRYLHFSDCRQFNPQFEWILERFQCHLQLPISLTIE